MPRWISGDIIVTWYKIEKIILETGPYSFTVLWVLAVTIARTGASALSLVCGTSTTLRVAVSLQTTALTHPLWADLISDHFVNLLNCAPFHFFGCIVRAITNRVTYFLKAKRNGSLLMWHVP